MSLWRAIMPRRRCVRPALHGVMSPAARRIIAAAQLARKKNILSFRGGVVMVWREIWRLARPLPVRSGGINRRIVAANIEIIVAGKAKPSMAWRA